MKGVNSKNRRTITTILFVLVVFVLGSFNFEFLNVQAESIEKGDEVKSLEIRQGDFLHYFVRGSEGLTFQLDVKDPESGDLYNWHILVPPIHGGASVSAEGKSTEVSYLPAEAYSGDDHFLVEVSTNTGAKARVNVAVTVTPGGSYPEVENLQKSERGEPAFPPRYQTEQEFPREGIPEGHRVDKPGMWEDEQDERFDPRLVEIDALQEMERQSQLDEIGRPFDVEGERGEPYISVFPQWKQVNGIGWSPNTSIILTIGTQEWTEESDEWGHVYFFTHPFDIQPGQVVEMTDGTYTRTHTVTSLTVTNVDETANTVSGTAEAGSDVHIYGSDDYDMEALIVTAVSSGDWTATFSIIDIAPGADGYAWQDDAEGNSTQIFWFVPDPYFQVYPKWDRITGYVWTPDTLVTATVGGNTIGSGWSDGFGWVFISSSFDLQPDDEVMLTDGIYTRTHTVTSLTVTNVDEVADSVSGTAEAGSDVHIDGSDDYDREALIVTADSSGDWTATFSIIDIAPGADGEAYQYDAEGNSTQIYWDVPDPRIQVYPLRDYIHGNDWAPNTPVTLTIGTEEWIEESDERGWVYFDTYPFDIQPGQVVEMTDGTYTRTHTVTSLTVTNVDEVADTVSGTAAVESEVFVDGSDGFDGEYMWVTVDTSGNWIANFPHLDIESGTYGKALQHDEEGNSTIISWNVPDPYLNVYPMGDYIYGYDWTPGVSVSATINGVIKGSGVPNQDGRVYIDLYEDLIPGQLVELTDGEYTRSHIVQNLFVTNIDQVGDFVQGTADPYSELRTYACDEYDCYWVYPQADSSGNWISNYSGLVDIDTEAYGWAYKYDDKGNSTRVHWYVTDPSFAVYPMYGEIYGRQWPPETTVTLTIGSQSWAQEANGYNGSVYFYPVIDLTPGLTVQMTDGVTTRTHTVIDLAVTDFDADADTLSGTADPGKLTVYTCDSYDCYYRYPTADGGGNWTADFSGLVDIAPGSNGGMYQEDIDGDETLMYWSLPDPLIEAHPNADTIHAYDWSPNTEVTLTINSEFIASLNSTNWGNVYFYLDTFDLLPGQEVVLSDGTYTKTHTVIDLAVTTVDEANDILRGTADPGMLTVDAYDDYNWERLNPVADENGNWTANFSTVDITEGTGASIYQFDEDNDSTYIYWLIPDPFMGVYPLDDYIYGSLWPQVTEITLTIDSGRETWVQTSSEYGSVYFDLEPFDLQPGDIVEMTADSYTQIHTVRDISVTEIDQGLDTVSGIADPGSEVLVCAYLEGTMGYFTYVCITTSADGSGNWLADFAGSGDITSGSWGGVRQYDENDNYTYVYWEVSGEAPVITGQKALSTPEETALKIELTDLIVSDTDSTYPDDFTLTVMTGTNYTLSGDTITPVQDFNGTLTVLVKVSDGTYYSNTFNLEVTVTPINDPPVITGQAALSTPEETALLIELADLTVTDVDNVYPDDFTLTVMTGTNYTLSGNTITPVLDFNGTLSVPVKVNDGEDDSNTFDLSVSVTPVNDPPVVGDIPNQSIEEGGIFTPITLDDCFSDVDNTNEEIDWDYSGNTDLTVTIVDRVATITFPSGWSGSEMITFTAMDPGGESDSDYAIFSVNAAANTKPVITESDPQSVTMSEDSNPMPFSLTLHATDADGDTITWSISSTATHGTATASGTGLSKAIGYTPDLNYYGSDSFVVQVNDDKGGTDTITVNVTIEPVNDAPVISGQATTLSTTEETELLITLTDLVVTDVDNTYPTDFTLTVLDGTNYTVSGNTITPIAGFIGDLTVQVYVNDGMEDSNIFELTVTVSEKIDEGYQVFLPLIVR